MTTEVKELDQKLDHAISTSRQSLPLVSSASALHIGIDARTLTFSETAQRGIGHYTVNHLEKVIELTPEWQYSLFLEGESSETHIKALLRYPNVSVRYFDQPTPKLDLFHIPDAMSLIAGFDSPMRMAPKAPISAVFYDLIPLAIRQHHFDAWDQSRQVVYMKRLEQLKSSGALILSISEHTKRDLIEHTGISKDKIVTIMAGPNKSASVGVLPPDKAAEMQKQLEIDQPFFLSVGGLDPHKEFGTTALAFIAASKFKSMNMVVVGSNNDPYKEAFKGLFDKYPCGKVVFTGYVSDQELKTLYSMATALIFPSRYEGFGLPVLEAMANGCPVIASNASSIPEVAGDAALLSEPGDVEGTAQAMLTLLDNPMLRADLSKRGKVQASKFSWDNVAKATLNAWKNFLGCAKLERYPEGDVSKSVTELLGS